jgi:hypothetical protein
LKGAAEAGNSAPMEMLRFLYFYTDHSQVRVKSSAFIVQLYLTSIFAS